MAHHNGIWWEVAQPGWISASRSVVAGQREVHTEGLRQTSPGRGNSGQSSGVAP
jgi:hypothetical protein